MPLYSVTKKQPLDNTKNCLLCGSLHCLAEKHTFCRNQMAKVVLEYVYNVGVKLWSHKRSTFSNRGCSHSTPHTKRNVT